MHGCPAAPSRPLSAPRLTRAGSATAAPASFSAKLTRGDPCALHIRILSYTLFYTRGRLLRRARETRDRIPPDSDSEGAQLVCAVYQAPATAAITTSTASRVVVEKADAAPASAASEAWPGAGMMLSPLAYLRCAGAAASIGAAFHDALLTWEARRRPDGLGEGGRRCRSAPVVVAKPVLCREGVGEEPLELLGPHLGAAVLFEVSAHEVQLGEQPPP